MKNGTLAQPAQKATADGFMQGVRDCLPTVLGYLSIGFAAGVVERTAGFSMLKIALISLLLYAGSAQFIAAGMMMAGMPPSAIVVTVFFVNLRHLLMGAALAPFFRHLPLWKNVLLGAQLTDETFGVAATRLAGKDRASFSWMLGLNVTAYLNWLVANLAGGLFGDWIAEPERFGLDYALPAMFLGLLALQWRERANGRLDGIVALSAVAVAVAGSVWLSPHVGVMLATVLAATIGLVLEKRWGTGGRQS